MVKWLYRSVYDPQGFDVYRSEGSGPWTKLNSSPVKPLKSLPAGHKLDKEATDLFSALNTISYEQFKTDMVRAFVLIKAIYTNELASAIGILYTDETAQIGKAYQYKVTLSSTGEEVAISKPFTSASYQKPGAPEQVKLSRSKKRVDMQWKPDIYRYYAVDIYRRTSEETEFTKITKVPRAIQKDQADAFSDKSIFYQDTSINYEANYIYRFVAIDYFGLTSDFSPEYSVPAKDFIPPSPVYNLVPTASSVNQNVRVDWAFVEEEDLAGFYVYHALNPDNGFTRVNKEIIAAPQKSFTTPAEPGGHYYLVASVDKAGNENPGSVAFVEVRDVVPPATPQNLSAESGEGYITLKWAGNTEGDLKGYFVQRSVNDDNNEDNAYININKDPITETTYTEQLPKNVRNKFVYRVVAMDTSFNRSKPSANSLAQMPDVIGPKKPLIKAVVVDTVSAIVQWLPNVDADLQGYNVYRSIKGDSASMEKVNFSPVPATVNSYTDRSVTSGTSYSYYLEAIDQSSNSSGISPGFDAAIPQRPASGAIVVENQKYNTRKKMLTLGWKASISGEVKGFVVYEKKTDSKLKPISGLLTDNYFQYNAENINDSEFVIRCYSTTGDIINSQPIRITKTE
jgi:hypothetical protein